MQHAVIQERSPRKVPESRYAYYRRCQELRSNGVQCKAPAEKGSAICHAHASQWDMAARRNEERRVVLERAAIEMRRRSRRQYTVAEMLMEFNGIQITLAVAAQALIDGTLSCKTAGRLLMDLQCMAKLLRCAKTISPPIFADKHGPRLIETALAANAHEKPRILELIIHPQCWIHGLKEWARAA